MRAPAAVGLGNPSNITLTAILNAKLDRNYGDVDVLAWRGTRVLAVECKSLEIAQTLGEIARQLHEFRGETHPHGKPDRLRKHLDRVKVLQERAQGVAALCGERGRHHCQTVHGI